MSKLGNVLRYLDVPVHGCLHSSAFVSCTRSPFSLRLSLLEPPEKRTHGACRQSTSTWTSTSTSTRTSKTATQNREYLLYDSTGPPKQYPSAPRESNLPRVARGKAPSHRNRRTLFYSILGFDSIRSAPTMMRPTVAKTETREDTIPPSMIEMSDLTQRLSVLSCLSVLTGTRRLVEENLKSRFGSGNLGAARPRAQPTPLSLEHQQSTQPRSPLGHRHLS